MSPFSFKSLNRSNSGSRGPREEVKKGKSSEFNPQNGEQVKLSRASNVWSHKGSNLDPKNHQNFITKIGAKFRNKHDPGVVVLA